MRRRSIMMSFSSKWEKGRNFNSGNRCADFNPASRDKVAGYGMLRSLPAVWPRNLASSKGYGFWFWERRNLSSLGWLQLPPGFASYSAGRAHLPDRIIIVVSDRPRPATAATVDLSQPFVILSGAQRSWRISRYSSGRYLFSAKSEAANRLHRTW